MNRPGHLQVQNVSFAFDNAGPLLEDISFEIAPGQCLGLRGASGIGKSTLAQILAGHVRPQKGRVLLDGADVTGRPQRDLFLVHQDSDLFPWLNVRQQIAFALNGQDQKKTDELIALTKLKGFADYYPHKLSGGMKKRLSVARALAVNPRVIIFDETFSSLDYELRLEMFKDLREIWRKTQTTILLISHDPRDLQEIAQAEIQLSPTRPARLTNS